MPPAIVLLFLKSNGRCPMEEMLRDLKRSERNKCLIRISELQARGHELRRPTAAYLRDDIHELRPDDQLRILYFFDGPGRAILTHVIKKKTDEVPPKEIDKAVVWHGEYLTDRKSHSEPYVEEEI